MKVLGLDSRCFDYVYDFGDDWHHVVTVEHQRVYGPKSLIAVHCLAGENSCPPEDVGGGPGYARFLEAIADKRHEEYDNYLRWAGGSFDPTRFDLQETNRALAKIKV